MSDRLDRLESEVRALRESLLRLRERIDALEEGGRAAAPRRHATPADGDRSASRTAVPPTETAAAGPSVERPPPDTPVVEEPRMRVGAGLVGGVLLVVAGGYLLRALTEAGLMPVGVGVVCGLVYAFAWSGVGYVLAGRGDHGAGAANGVATALVALPLIWEATVRFEVLPPWPSAVLLLVVGATLMPLAEIHRLAAVAWFAVLGIGATAVALIFGTRTFEPYALTLLLLGVTAAVLSSRRGGLLPWVAYAFADLGALLLVVGSLGERVVTVPTLATPILFVFFLAFMGIFVHRTWRTGELALDEPVQGTLATLLGFGGALLVATADLPAVAPWLATTGLGLGVAGYVVLLTLLRWTREHRWPFLLYSSLALGTVAMAVIVLFSESGWVFAGLAVALGVVGAWSDRVSPGLHAAMSLVLAAVTGELAGTIRSALVSAAGAPAPVLESTAIATLAAAFVCAALPLRVRSPVWPSWLPRLGRAVVILVAALGTSALLLRGLLPGVGGGLAEGGAAAAAALRTGVLAALIVLLAILSRWRPLQPGAWLVYPLLVATGIKLVVVDFPRGSALSMAIALLLYGGALILAPRFAHLRGDRSRRTAANG